MLQKVKQFIGNRAGIVLTIIVTFFLVMALSNIVIFTIFHSASRMLQEEIILRCQETIDSLIQNNAKVYYSSQETLQQWSFDNELRSYSYDPAKDDLSKRYEYVPIWQKIKTTFLFHNYLENMFLFYPKSDTVIGNQSHLQNGDYLRSFVFPELFETRDEMLSYLNGSMTNGTNALLVSSNSENYILLWQKALQNTYVDSELYIFFMINAKKLVSESQVGDYAWDSIYFVDENNKILAYEGIARPELLASLTLEGSKGVIDEGDTIFVYNTSSILKCRYIISFPKSVIMEKVRNIGALTLFLNLFYLAFAILILAYYIHWNRKHINNILAIVKKYGIRVKPQKNEYNMIFSAMDTTLRDKKYIKELYDKYANVISNNMLQQLVLGIGSRPGIDEINGHFSFRFNDTAFAVALSQIEDYHTALYSEQDTYLQNVQLLHFAIRNVAEEMLPEPFYLCTTEIDNRIVFIINLPDDKLSTYNLLQKELTRVIEKCNEILSVYLILALSSVKKGVDSLPMSYQQAVQTIQGPFVKDQALHLYQDIDLRGQSPIPHLSSMTEQQIINIIKTGDFNNSETVIRFLFQSNSEPMALIDHKKLRFFAYDLSCMLVKAMQETGLGESSHSVQEKILEIPDSCSFKIMQTRTLEAARELCVLVKESKRSGQSFFQDVKTYIGENYQNINLGLASLSDSFHLSTFYLSRMFKEAFGMGIPEYINHVRIEHAKALLLEEKINAGEICRMVGYNDYTSFSRVFKRIVGVSPQKFRESNDNL